MKKIPPPGATRGCHPRNYPPERAFEYLLADSKYDLANYMSTAEQEELKELFKKRWHHQHQLAWVGVELTNLKSKIIERARKDARKQAQIAQQVEHPPCKREVIGSIPILGTTDAPNANTI